MSAERPLSASIPKVSPVEPAIAEAPTAANELGVTPDWLRSSTFYERTTEYLRLTWWMLRAPGSFIEAWASGAEPMPNPLHLWVTMTAISISLTEALVRELVGPLPSLSLVGAFVGRLISYSMPLGASAVAHVVCRRFGGKRGLGATVGAALWASAGPGAALSLVALGWVALRHAFGFAPHLFGLVPQTVQAHPASFATTNVTQLPAEMFWTGLVATLYVPWMIARVQRVRIAVAAIGLVAGVAAAFLLFSVVVLTVVLLHHVLH